MKALILGLISLALLLVGCNQEPQSVSILPVTITKTVLGPTVTSTVPGITVTVTVTSIVPILKPTTDVPTLQPAHFVLSELTITPSSVKMGDTVTANILVSNTGGIEGTYVVIYKDDAIEDSRTVTLNAGETMVITYATTKNLPGTYFIDINGKVGQYTVTVLPSPPVSSVIVPAGATPLCRDGTYSYSQTSRGT